MRDRVLIIAEAGVNHNGDLNLATELIDLAAESGADFVKFQTFNADSLVTADAEKAPYQNSNSAKKESQLDMLRRLELSPENHYELAAYCKQRDVGFLSTAFDIESLNFLFDLGQKIFKIPSGEITNLPYLQHLGKVNKSIILSTGMANMTEIEAAIICLEQSGTRRDDMTVLHCTSEYPAPIKEVNLRAMQSIHTAFGVAVGYSDHTMGIEVPIAAAALGATVIEKHITINQMLPGPDHRSSLGPGEFMAMVAAIRNIEQALGDGIKCPTPSEARNAPLIRKSLVATRPIKLGECFSGKNITAKRPAYGISPMRWNEVIGQIAPRDFAKDEPIEL